MWKWLVVAYFKYSRIIIRKECVGLVRCSLFPGITGLKKRVCLVDVSSLTKCIAGADFGFNPFLVYLQHVPLQIVILHAWKDNRTRFTLYTFPSYFRLIPMAVCVLFIFLDL